MHAPEHEMAWAMAVQVAFSNGLRGLLALEVEANPEIQACSVEIDRDGAIDVKLLSASGMPIGGYSL